MSPAGLRPRLRPGGLAAAAVVAMIGATLGVTPASAATVPVVADPAAYVNPMVGTTNAGNVYPGAVVPFGMLSWSPQTSRGNQVSNPAPGGYAYSATRVRGFSLAHLEGVGCSGGEGEFPILPYVGAVDTSPAADTTDAKYASTFSHANETASAGYYKLGLDSGAGAELTTTERTGAGRFSFPAGGKAASMLFRTAMAESGSTDASVSIDAATRTVTGSVNTGNFCGPQSANNSKDYYTVHFTAHFDTPFAGVGTWKDAALTPGSTSATGGTGYSAAGNPVAGRGSGGYVTFAPGTTNVGLKVAISYVSVANAEANLQAESPAAKSFAAVRAAAYAQWRAALRRIEIGGGTADQKSVFYTALYHSMLEPTIASDVNGQYLGAERATHSLEPGQRTQYGTFSGWDQYRAQIQLLTLLDPKRGSDYAQSLFNYAKQRGGEWDRWLLQNGKTSVMSGDPSAATVAEVYAFGGHDFDVKGAFDSLVRAATVVTPNDLSDAGCNVECVGERPSVDRYQSLGYVPADNCHCWAGASETLEDAAADYGLAELAQARGDQRAAKTFLARSESWRNNFDPTATAPVVAIPGSIRTKVAAITASAQNPPGEVAVNLNDANLGTKWLAFANTGWVQYKLTRPTAVVGYALSSANDAPGRDPRNWTLQGSNDGTSWTPVDTQTGQTFSERLASKQYQVAHPTPYLYYRLDVTLNSGDPIVQLSELQLSENLNAPVPVPANSFSGYMRDRNSDGTWVGGFTPATGTGFVEGTSARYTWMVYSDVSNLAQAMGGKDIAIKRLDDFFHASSGAFDFSARDDTKYDPTNEPDIHTPYIYDYLGAPWKTQETVRAEIDQLWSNTTGGIPGNDDAGTMSAWLIWSAMGMYPGVPTRADLVLTSPLFSHVAIHRANGVDITIDARDASSANRYIQSLTVNGQASSRPWVPASLVNGGGSLVYGLGSSPNKTWGTAAADAPPQTSNAQALDAVAHDLQTRGDVTGSVGRDVEQLARTMSGGSSPAAMQQARTLLADVESSTSSKMNPAARNRLRSILQSVLGLPSGLATLRQQIGDLTRSGAIASSTGRDLQDTLTAAEAAQTAGNTAALRTALGNLQSTISGAPVNKVSQAAKDQLLPLLAQLVRTV